MASCQLLDGKMCSCLHEKKKRTNGNCVGEIHVMKGQ